MALLVIGLALFPVPDNIGTVAVLESADRQLYFAPCTATVENVLVSTNQLVKTGEPLVKLRDNQLSARFDELQGQKLSIAAQLKDDQDEFNRGVQSTKEDFHLSSRIRQQKISMDAIDKQLRILETQLSQLTIVAQRDALVTTWDARNQLTGRPVTAGQLLLTTYQPTAPWQLRLSIPERQLGRLRDAMASSRDGLMVQYSLSSHPSEVRWGRLVNISDQLIKDEAGNAKALGIVAIDGNNVPAKSDGAVARATIACGRTSAGWLVIRDAYREASAWWRLNW